MINKIFSCMDDWRHLPAYQLERRADIFFSVYLNDIIFNKYGVCVKNIIPEFPIRKGELPKNNQNNQSVKVDYLVQLENEKVILVELKTDSKSRRKDQDRYLTDAKDYVQLKRLVDGVIKINDASQKKEKYQHLLNKMSECGWITSPKDPKNKIISEPEMFILFIQPKQRKKQDGDLIDFDEVADIISNKYKDELSVRFCQSLRKWEKEEV